MGAIRNEFDIFDREREQGMFTVRYMCMRWDKPTGDCILMRAPGGETMLVDSGVPHTASQVLDYLDRLGVETLDIVLLTHPHLDHVGGMARILEEKYVQQLYTINISLEDLYTDAYRDAEEVLARKQIPRLVVEEGVKFRLGPDVEIEVLSPDKGMNPAEFESKHDSVINHHSMVYRVTYKRNSFLFSTDIYEPREQMLIEKYGDRLKADMMHAPHHGSTSSSSVPYITAVNPQISVVSFRVNNRVTAEILARYRALGVTPYHVGIHGNILLMSDGDRIQVVTENGVEQEEKIVE
ncbi:ComEC/Rec2 family competence protein [Paenibacillus sp. HJGM_3]|uniref:ComEC/Rec2 family competence protein n=1 Tax=Paenibacillus sp. HJGM_3 TaxID=3379816 RepID=UPI00385CB55F